MIRNCIEKTLKLHKKLKFFKYLKEAHIHRKKNKQKKLGN
jgi:hypothetical protein